MKKAPDNESGAFLLELCDSLEGLYCLEYTDENTNREESASDHHCQTALANRITPLSTDSTIPVMSIMRISQAPFEPSSVRILITI
jgi:hypothetical protein